MRRSSWMVCVSLIVGIGLVGGCERRSGESSDEGKVNVHVNTPAGGYNVNIQTHKDRDGEKPHQDTKVKVEHE